MPNDIDQMLTAAKGTLAKANSSFPSSMAPKAPIATPVKSKPVASKSYSIGEPEPGIAKELSEKAKTVSQVANAPKMHKGGPVKADGIYNLRAGEHVLTEPEARLARRHAIMAAGLKSLAKKPMKRG